MSIILYIILFLLIVIMLIVVGVIFIPVKYNIGGGYKDILVLEGKVSFCNFIRLTFFYEDENISLRLWGISLCKKGKNYNNKIMNKEKIKEKKYADNQEKENDEGTYKKRLEGLLENKDMIINILKTAKIHKLILEGTYGFSEPDLTGMVSGFVYSLYGVEFLDISNLNPQFLSEEFDVKAKLVGEISMFNILKLIIKRSS